MAERWYFLNTSSPAPYVPATWHGSWGSTPSSATYTKAIDPVKWALNGSNTSAPTSYTGTGPTTLGARRFVSRRLAPQTIAGTVDMVAAVLDTLGSGAWYTRVYIWVSQGDSDTARGVLLDYTEASGVGGATAWPTTRTGKTFASTQALSSVNAIEGDRLVVEFGASRGATSSGTYNASVQVGTWGFGGAVYADLAAAETPTTNRAGFLEFSAAIAISATEPTHLSPATAELITTLPLTDTVTPIYNQTEFWYRFDAVTDTVLGTFMGRSSGGSYESLQTLFKGPVDAGFVEYLYSSYSIAARPYVVPVLAGTTMYFRSYALGSGSSVTGTFVFTATAIPIYTGDLTGTIVITNDNNSASALPLAETFAYVISPTTGAVLGVILGVPAAENAAIIASVDRMLIGNERSRTDLLLFDSTTLTLVTTIAGAVANLGTIITPICATLAYFYVAQYRADLGAIIRLLQVAPDGTLGATWDMTAIGANVTSLAVSMDDAVAYYGRNVASTAVKRWDLVNDVALGDLAAADASFAAFDIMVLQDTTILVLWWSSPSGGADHIVRYDAAGTVLHTYYPKADLGVASSYFVHHIRPGVDDPLTFWVWLEDNSNSLNATTARYVQYRTSDGVILTDVTGALFRAGVVGPTDIADGAVPPFPASPAGSCPLLIMPPPSGTEPEPEPEPEPAPAYETRTLDQRRLRRASHLSDEHRWLTYDRFQLDLQAGVGLTDGQGEDPQVMVRWSNDGGHTWSREQWRTAGRQGARRTRVIVRQTGRARVRTFEVVVSDPVAWYLAAAYLDVTPGDGN